MLSRAVIHRGWVFKQGISVNSPPPAARKVSRPRMPISSSVSRQSDTKDGQMTRSFLMPALAKSGKDQVGVGFEPRLASQTGLKGDGMLVFWNRGHPHKGFHRFETLRAIAGAQHRAAVPAAIRLRQAMAAGGVGLAQMSLRDAVKTEKQVVVVLFQILRRIGRHGPDVIGMIIEGRRDRERHVRRNCAMTSRTRSTAVSKLDMA